MTTKEATKLAVATDNIKTIRDDIKEIKDILATQEARFITRLEGKAAAWLVSAAFGALTLYGYFFKGLK